MNKDGKSNTKMVIVFVGACLVLVGGIVATFFIPSAKPASKESTQEESVTEDAPTLEEYPDYDKTELVARAKTIEKTYTRFSSYTEYKYGSEQNKIDFSDDTEAQTMWSEFILAVDQLGLVIDDCPYVDIKESWSDFIALFDARRESITHEVDQEKDAEWALQLLFISSLIQSKADTNK